MSYVAILVGLLLIALAAIGWRSEAFFEYFWRVTAATRTHNQPKLSRSQGRIGVRGALTLAALAGLVLVAAGVRTLA